MSHDTVSCLFSSTDARLYFVGLAAAYSLSFVLRWAIALFNGFQHRATISQTGRLIHVEIPSRRNWKAGQHYFFRFCTGDRHFFSSHPFTVASVPEDGRIELFIKAREGMTKALMHESTPVRVLLDGPYGGPAADLAFFDGVLLIAGGSGGFYQRSAKRLLTPGISFILSLLRHLTTTKRSEQVMCRHVTVVYSSRHEGAFTPPLDVSPTDIAEQAALFLDQVDEILRQAHPDGPSVDIHCHLSTMVDLYTKVSEVPEGGKAEPGSQSRESLAVPTAVKPARPDIPALVLRMAYFPTAGVAVCGPDELQFDARNAVAQVQLQIVKERVPCRECYLHTEAFGW